MLLSGVILIHNQKTPLDKAVESRIEEVGRTEDTLEKDKEMNETVNSTKGKVNHITLKQYKEVKDEQYILVFGSKHCGACKDYLKTLEDYSKSKNPKPIYYIDISDEENYDIAEDWNIENVPFSLLIEDGKVANSISGSIGIQSLMKFVNKVKL